ncbi:hypothetical protein TNCV_2652091 [Trichonephila clavipes]|nr:hypothetical protein TNCV_2652091 [Trichonephila clavipes]
MNSSREPLKTHRTEEAYSRKKVQTQTSSRWCGVEVRRWGVLAQVSSSSLDRGSKLRDQLDVPPGTIDGDSHTWQ